MLPEFLMGKKKCNHEHLNIDSDFGYCPDCGKFIENQWFLIRCACCGIKQKAKMKEGKIIPITKFCKNCGTAKYNVEQLRKINFIDINYAVLMQKSENHFSAKTLTQSWVDFTEKSDGTPKLLPLFR